MLVTELKVPSFSMSGNELYELNVQLYLVIWTPLLDAVNRRNIRLACGNYAQIKWVPLWDNCLGHRGSKFKNFV